MPEKILIIEDDARMRRVLQLILETGDYLVETAEDGADGIVKWKIFEPDLVFTDLKMPGVDGIEVLKHRNLKYPRTPLIILTAFGTVSTAVDAMKKGAFDYITKPVDNDIILEKARMALAGRKPAKTKTIHSANPSLIGSSQSILKLKKELELVASTATSVMIIGESGTGKELAARTIQLFSPRRENPFIKVNCAAIPRDLMESELFGHIKGAFTGAVQDRKGAFELAHTGTLFLDEIGDMPYELQAKLLHAVEDKTILPVGSAKPIHMDVKIISATNQNIPQMVAAKTFRSDLFFRLNTYCVSIPPLREREGDIPELVHHFLDVFSQEFGCLCPELSQEAMNKFKAYSWPGNVRELKNIVERLVLVSQGEKITLDMAEPLLNTKTLSESESHAIGENKDLFTREREMIEEALIESGWNISKASRQLGITRNTLRYRIRKFGLDESRLK